MDQLFSLQDLVEAKLYESEKAAIQDALRHLIRSRPDLRIKVAINRYKTDLISLAKAAHLAGVSWQQMREILMEQGIPIRLGPETVNDAQAEVNNLRRHM